MLLCDAQAWAPAVESLPSNPVATALDLPSVADLDARVDEVAGYIEPGSVEVPHSLGRVVTAHLAERAPEPPAGLVLVTAAVGA